MFKVYESPVTVINRKWSIYQIPECCAKTLVFLVEFLLLAVTLAYNISTQILQYITMGSKGCPTQWKEQFTALSICWGYVFNKCVYIYIYIYLQVYIVHTSMCSYIIYLFFYIYIYIYEHLYYLYIYILCKLSWDPQMTRVLKFFLTPH